MRAGRRPAVAALLTLACGLVAGCVSVPTSGPVDSVGEPPTVGSGQVNVPAGPAPGASRGDVVQGFLAAMEALPVSTEVATTFLTEQAAQRWHPERRTVVYYDPEARALPGRKVAVRVRQVASLTRRGTYVPAGANQMLREVFSLARVDGEWRIDRAPDAVLVRGYFFEQNYRAFDLYFPDPSGTALVAEPVYLPIGDQLATRLVQGLLAGPTRWLGDQAVAAVSRDTEVEVSVPLQPDGIADVQLSEHVNEASAHQLQLLSAQLVSTLAQVEGIDGIRITVDGSPLSVEGAGVVQSMDAWPQYDPSGSGFRDQLYALDRGALTVVGEEGSVSGFWGSRRARLVDFSVDRYGTVIGAVDQGRTRLLEGNLSDENRSAVNTWYTARGRLSDPQWDVYGRLWVLDRTRSGTSWVVADGNGARRVQAGPLESLDVSAMAVSADGARVAVLVDRWDGPVWGGGRVVGEAVVVARVVRGGPGRGVQRLDQAYAVPTRGATFTHVYDLDWGAPTRVVVLADIGPQPTQPFELALDGSALLGGPLSGEALLPDVGARTLAAVGIDDAPTVVGDARGNLSVLGVDEPWSVVAEGLRRPHYPS